MAELRIEGLKANVAEVETPLMVVHAFQDEPRLAGVPAPLDRALGGAVERLFEAGDFAGHKEETALLYPPEGALPAERVLLVGLGKHQEADLQVLRRCVGVAVRQAERLGLGSLTFSIDHLAGAEGPLGSDPTRAAQAMVEAVALAAWDFLELKTQSDPDAPRTRLDSVRFVASAGDLAARLEQAIRFGQATSSGENLARGLAARPGNVATPSYLAEVARDIADRRGLSIDVLDREAMRKEGMKALLAVAQGSEEEPRFIALQYRGTDQDAPPLALVGKGVTFDAGGISIKPAASMEEMKYDMSGAAAVLGAIDAIAALRLEVNVVALVPSTENLISGRAVKPGDVIGSHLGKTIEVVNTDAEGRLILADALSYARRFRPAAMVDAATLTGACVIALGQHAMGLMGTDDQLVEQLRAAGERCGERCWPLPLWSAYRKQIDSDIADVKNSGGRPAGTITAGLFLREFVVDIPWAHLDIAGTAWGDQLPPYLRKGATGVPTRLFIEWVRGRAEA